MRKYAIINQHGEKISNHYTYEAAEKKHKKDLAWRCGLCGSSRRGWGACSHGTHNRVCSADAYNHRIVVIND